jgi:hypothetical protein
MPVNFSKMIASAASTGLMLGALAGCDDTGRQGKGAKSPSGSRASSGGSKDGEAAGAKACCKGMNECRGKGGCAGDGHDCAGKNECKGKGSCNAHCPK